MVIAGLIVLWLLTGFLRGPSLAASAEAAFENGKTVSEVQTTTFPVVPPFFVVQGRATVTEATGAHYPSGQTYLIEPFSGWTVNLSHLGLAPSA